MSDVDPVPPDAAARARVAELIDRWLTDLRAENPVVEEVAREDGDETRWYVRVTGDSKDVFAIWFALRQRSLAYETYVMPKPDENEALFYEHLLRRNAEMAGIAFDIGEEDGVYLRGRFPLHLVDEAQLDRVFGSLYVYVERFFRPALRIGFASRLAARGDR